MDVGSIRQAPAQIAHATVRAYGGDGQSLFVSQEQREEVLRNTPIRLQRRVDEAHFLGPVPPQVAEVRNNTFHVSLAPHAALVCDPIFELFSTLSAEDVRTALLYLRAHYNSDDCYPELSQTAFGSLRPLLFSDSDRDNTLAVGSLTYWERNSQRVDYLGAQIGKHMVHLAQHCPDYAHSSGGWVSFDAVLQKLEADGYRKHTLALALHGLSSVAPGLIEV